MNRDRKTFLFLQGPLSDFYDRIAAHLIRAGHRVYKVHLCGNDVMDWSQPGAVSFRGSLDTFEPFLEDRFGHRAITHMLYHGDRRPYHRKAVHWADKHQINCVTTELGYLRPDWMTIEYRASSTGSYFPTDPDQIRQVASDCPDVTFEPRYKDSTFSLIAQEARFTVFNLLFWPFFPRYMSHRSQSPFVVYSGWLMAKTKAIARHLLGATLQDPTLADLQQRDIPYFILGLQLDGDFQLRDHSPFASLTEVLEIVLLSFAHHAPDKAHLIIKPHPHESRHRALARAIGKIAARLGVEERMTISRAPTIRTLCAEASGFVTVNSSAGFEALDVACPTLSIMPTLYDVDGLTHQGSLETFWTEAQRPNTHLFQSLKRAMVGHIQVRGTLYNREGREDAARLIAERLSHDLINTPGARTEDPPRLAKAKAMGVDYSQ